jgi:succinylglutamate desuccinylase
MGAICEASIPFKFHVDLRTHIRGIEAKDFGGPPPRRRRKLESSRPTRIEQRDHRATTKQIDQQQISSDALRDLIISCARVVIKCTSK